jgi:hypothetical protein
VNIAARGPRDLRGQQTHRPGPDDQHLAAAPNGTPRREQRMAHAGERLAERRHSPIQPLGKPMQVRDRNEQPRSERTVDMRAD